MKIFCYGDSNTYGYDPRSFFGSQYPQDQRWVDLLARKLGWEAVNGGENGRQIPVRARQLEEFNRMLNKEKDADLLVIMLGTNDLLQGNSAQSVILRMRSFLEQIPMDRSRILLIAPVPLQLGEWVPTQRLSDASEDLRIGYKTLAQELGVDFADAGTWNVPLSFDGVHFTGEGHRAFAEGLSKQIYKGE